MHFLITFLTLKDLVLWGEEFMCVMQELQVNFNYVAQIWWHMIESHPKIATTWKHPCIFPTRVVQNLHHHYQQLLSSLEVHDLHI